MSRLGIGIALLVLPVALLGGSAAFLVLPILLVGSSLNMVDNLFSKKGDRLKGIDDDFALTKE